MGVYPSLMRQWTMIARSPTPQVLRRVAALFDIPVREVLVAAGYMTEEENVPLPATRTLLQQISNKQILDELRRRTAGDGEGTPIPVRVDGVLHTPEDSLSREWARTRIKECIAGDRALSHRVQAAHPAARQ